MEKQAYSTFPGDACFSNAKKRLFTEIWGMNNPQVKNEIG